MNNLRIIGRNFFKHGKLSLYILINFVVAFTCVILIYVFVNDEFAFDKHFANFNKTYRLNMQAKDKSIVNCNFPGVLHNNLEQVSGFENYARLQTFMGERYVVIDNQTLTVDKFLFGDPEILKIFDFDFLIGNANEALNNPFDLIISQSTAEKYFGNENPLGKIVQLENHDFKITAVIKDLPKQTHFGINFLASVSSYRFLNNDLLSQWYMSSFNYYFTLSDGIDKKVAESQITAVFAEGNGIPKEKIEFEMVLEPMRDIHLKSVNTRWDNAIKGDIKVVYGFIAIALLILGIAIANYVNILTSNYQQKIKENSIRKINGASELSLVLLQIVETFLLLFIALIAAILMAYLVIPYVNGISGKVLNISFNTLLFVSILLFSVLVISITYPVLFMKSFKTSELLKNHKIILNLKSQKQHFWVRNSLVTFQFIIATILITATLVVYSQLHLITKLKTGFDQENTLLIINPYGETMNKRYNLFKEKISSFPMIQKVGVAQNAPGGFIYNFTPVWFPGRKDELKVDLGQITVDHDFLPAIGANFLYGKNFDKNIIRDGQLGIVINQSAVTALQLTDPIGQKVVVENNAYTPNNEMEIIGVVEDMQYFTLKESAKPIMYFIREWGYYNIVVRLEKGDYKTTLQQIEKTWTEVEPVLPFKYQFMDERISANYASEINTAKIITILSVVSIFLSILGIIGVAIFTIQQRTKEIGIRKVNGAKISEILVLLNRDFVKWVAIAFVIATPIAYYAMNLWLENFAYKTELSWWIFALAGLLALGVALVTVSFQSWKAATRNPVEALRYE